MKPSNLSIIEITPINIGLTVIKKLEIDLCHINYGLNEITKDYNKKARSNFTELEVTYIFNTLDGFFLSPSGIHETYMYFAQEIDYLKKDYLLVFCIDKKSIHTAGVITLYKIKK